MRLIAITTGVLLALSPAFLEAQEHDDHGEEAPELELKSMEDVVNATAFFQRQVNTHIKYDELEKIHGAAFTAADAATSASDFAKSLPEEKRQKLESHVSRIQAMAKQLDKYGDAGQKPQTEAYAKRFETEVNAMAELLEIKPDEDYVPRATDGATFVPHMDHSPKHGGIFFMAEGEYYHLEGTYPAPGEVRVYIYDDRTKPTDASKVTGKIDHDGKEYDLKPVEGGDYLKASLPGDPQPPLGVTAKLNLPDPKNGEISTEEFDFDFDELSKEGDKQEEAKPVKAQRKTAEE